MTNESNFEFIVGIVDGVPHEDGGTTADVVGITNGEPEVAREVLTDHYGVEPVAIAQVARAEKARRNKATASFGRWNSSWDPHAQGNEQIYH